MNKKNQNKWYVVAEGREKGLFDSWEECFQSVNKFKGAVYKSFCNLYDAYEYIIPNLKEDATYVISKENHREEFDEQIPFLETIEDMMGWF